MKRIGVLTSGGDCPGLNAAIRGLCRAGQETFGMKFVGFLDGFRGLVNDQTLALEIPVLSGILTDGGTILGTSRDKPHRMMIKGRERDMTAAAIKTYRRHRLNALVCIGGGGTQKIALRLKKAGLNIVTLPKTIDNDVAATDISFGFNTAMNIAADAVDRLHSTAMSHGRIIVVEVMGHRAGWIALGAGIAGGADVVLIPEIPYDTHEVARAVRHRTKAGKKFSIIVVAEGAMSRDEAKTMRYLAAAKEKARTKREKRKTSKELQKFHEQHLSHTVELTREIEKLTGLESRLTILGHLQRGGTPSSADRVLATRLGTACAELLHRGVYGVMVAARGDGTKPVPLEDVVDKKKFVPLDHPWVKAARYVGTSFGD